MTMPTRLDWTTVVCDSLEKVFADEEPRAFDTEVPLVGFRGETISFQVAVLPPFVRKANSTSLDGVRVDVAAPATVSVEVRAVELVGVELAAHEDADNGYLRTGPGLYPDLLRPLGDDGLQQVAGQWRAAWVDLTVAGEADGSAGDVEVTLSVGESTIGVHRVPLRIMPARLPELEITNTHWFHCDGLAEYYGDEVFGEAHWSTIDNFLAAASGMSVNSVLTPVWTPPLDTEVGTTRTPTQLVGIRDLGGERYEFDMTGLRRWLGLCRKHGMRTVEIAHLFTQWGARATPAIYVSTDTGLEQRFGWHVPATDPRYRRLLEQLIPALRALLEREWSLDRVLFHISDEPRGEHAATYGAARDIVADLLEGFVVVDAISDFDLFATGLVPVPVVATDHAEPFLAAGVEPLWLYYCGAQDRDVANRFIAQPSTRNRVLGVQLFLTGAQGFLHWGFNFYNTARSTRATNPFSDTCAGGKFIGGDAFVVYPGEGRKPYESIRYRVFAEAMADYRTMQLLRELSGDTLVRSIVDPGNEITLTTYPQEAEHYRRVGARLADEIEMRLPSS